MAPDDPVKATGPITRPGLYVVTDEGLRCSDCGHHFYIGEIVLARWPLQPDGSYGVETQTHHCEFCAVQYAK